jgi:hypothetical protein
LANDNRALTAAIAIACSALALLGSDASAQSATPAADARKTVRMVRTTTPPVIDGKLDEAVWQTADAITDFHQIRPGDARRRRSRPRSMSSTTTTPFI